MEPLRFVCFLLFIFSTVVTTLPIDGQNPHGENCSCVTKEEVYDLWGRVTALESFMNETEVFEDEPAGTNSSNSTYLDELGYTNNSASFVDSSNRNSSLTVKHASKKEENGTSQFTQLVKQGSETTESSFDGDDYTSATEGEDVYNGIYGGSQISTTEKSIHESVTESIDYHNIVKKDHGDFPETETDRLFSDALSDNSQQIKLNHSLLTATYSSILSLKERINSLNVTVQQMLAAIKSENYHGSNDIKSNKISQMLKNNRLFTENPTSSSLETDGSTTEKGYFVQLVKLVAAMEERLNLLDSRVQSQLQEGNSGSFTSRDACEGARKHRIGSSCYSVPKVDQGSKLFTWWDARFWCKDNLGPAADLVTIGDEKEMQQVISLLNNHFGDIEEFWLGGNDLVQEGDWRWISNNQPISFSHWRDGPPSGDQFKHCMSMLAGRQWVPEPCYFDRYPLCELQLDL